MKQIFKYFLLGILILPSVFGAPNFVAAATNEDPVYTTLRTIDIGTFNEYRYRITEKFFTLREHFEINDEMNIGILKEIAVLADTGYKYLPNNLKNKNYLNKLIIDIQKGIKSPGNEIVYVEIIKSIAAYLENVEINSIKGSVEASPDSGNAPLTTTLRGKVQDPTGTQILSGNYTWWVDQGGKKIVIGRGPSINYTFKEEGKFSIFLDVTSSHKNEDGYTDVLPFRSRADINVNEKIASLIVKVNGERVIDNEEFKFTPDDASYGLLFDATSSTPTAGTKFSSTEWDFGNGVKKSYSGGPKIERVQYGREGDYQVTLKLKTNELKTATMKFTVSIHDPIAKIEFNREDGYIGDKFTFSANSSSIYRDLTYNWEIVDIDADKVIYQKSDKLFTYTFSDKGKYNVRLKVRQSSGEVDQDTHIIYITSQSPIAEFSSSIPAQHKPNRVLLDASRSFDPDFSDDGKLTYSWYIDGNKVNLEDANANGSVGYYTFASVGSHSVNLEVIDPDGIMSVKKADVQVDSILSVEMYAFPRVIQRNNFIRFVAESPEAEVYEWNFGDGQETGGNFDKVTHTYEKSGTFNVTLKVSDKDNKTNTYARTIYVSDSNAPYAVMDISFSGLEKPLYDAGACNGVGAYMIDRVQTIKFDGVESINIDGETNNLEYSWKIGQSKFSSAQSVSHRFDEIGCFPVKLSVKSKNNGSLHSTETMVEVQNVKPTLTSLAVQVENPETDPLVIRVVAQGATDLDGVIQSYLWYYYTDIDTEPQDFRSTATNSTAFVIPKITGNYYFVAILKDNNEARVTSEEVTGARYFTTITGDNINTPIVELSVNDNATVIGEEVIFTAKAHNILGQSVEKDASFSWDFDGDGFYDTQTNDPTISYKYRKSGEFYAKVKVKYKGISSTKNITINVSNKLVPDFEYISIGNKFIFFDSSQGQVETRSWDLGDGTKKTGTYFEHTYGDKETNHVVNLKITEGTKIKEIQKTVSKNVKNILKTRGQDLIVFSSPELSETGSITLENDTQKFFVYLGESTDTAVAYIIDYDIEHDSDLNGGSDDDADNIGTASYISGDVIEIPLSPYNIQKVRVYLKDVEGNIIASSDIQVNKVYIEELNIDPDTIIFEGVTESEKQKIEDLKKILIQLPQQQKLKALSYVQRLQENWNDNTEKTRTILDFENYIFELALSNEDEIITLLESLLVEGQADQSARNIAYQALVNLIPQAIECSVETGTCYDNLLTKLEDIRNSDDIEYNKSLGKEILEVIGTTDLMTTDQKLDFKAILTSLVYGGNIENIPTEEKQDIVDQNPQTSDIGGGTFMKIVILLAKILGYIIALFFLIIVGFYIFYRIFNKDKTLSFSQFISKKTSFTKDEASSVQTDIFEDVLGDAIPVLESEDILSIDESKQEPKKSVTQAIGEKQTLKKEEAKTTSEEVPDWLKGSFTSPTKDEKKGIVKEEAPKLLEKQKEVIEEIKKVDTFDIEAETKIETDTTPDWLKGAFTEKKNNIPEEVIPTSSNTGVKTEDIKKKEEQVEEKKSEIPVKTSEESIPEKPTGDPQVPDWLKGSFDNSTSSKKEVEKEEIKTKESPKKEEKETKEVKEEKTSIVKKETNTLKKTTPKNKSSTSKGTEEKTIEKIPGDKPKPDKKPEKKEELWDDGMKIPDWLKADDE